MQRKLINLCRLSFMGAYKAWAAFILPGFRTRIKISGKFCRRVSFLQVILSIICCGVGSLRAETNPFSSDEDSCFIDQIRPTLHQQGIIAQVTPDFSFVLDNGDRVRLAGLDFPFQRNLTAEDNISLWAGHFRQFLEENWQGQKIRYNNDPVALDRTDTYRSQILLEEEAVWGQAFLLAEGWATLLIDPDFVDCLSILRHHENQGHHYNRGIWAENWARPLSTEEAADHLFAYHMVTGRVHDVHFAREWGYINFAEDWRQDFTIGFDLSMRENLEEKFGNLEQLVGCTVHVRGFIRPYNGPFIGLQYPDSLALLPPCGTVTP